MSKETKINASDDAWESGQLGRNAEFVRVSKNANESNVDDAIGLKLISIRLQKSLIEDFKNLARFNGISFVRCPTLTPNATSIKEIYRKRKRAHG